MYTLTSPTIYSIIRYVKKRPCPIYLVGDREKDKCYILYTVEVDIC